VAFRSSFRVAPPERLSRSRTLAVLLPGRAPVAFLGDLADVAPLLPFFAGLAFVARPSPGRRNVGPVCSDTRLSGGLWLLSRGTGFGVGGFCWTAVHSAFSLSGDYRDPMDHSASPDLQANSGGNPHGRRIGDGGEFSLPVGADGARC